LAAFLAAFFFFFAIDLAPSNEHPDTHHTPDPWGAPATGSGDVVDGTGSPVSRRARPQTRTFCRMAAKTVKRNPRFFSDFSSARTGTGVGAAPVDRQRRDLPDDPHTATTPPRDRSDTPAAHRLGSPMCTPQRRGAPASAGIIVGRVGPARRRICGPIRRRHPSFFPTLLHTVLHTLWSARGNLMESSNCLRTAARMAALEPSATLAMAARAAALKAAGQDVIDLSVGEPDFPTPEHVCRAAEAAIRAGKTKYTPAAGIPELRKAVAEDYSRRSGLAATAAQVVVSSGAKHALHNVFTATLDPGDEVVVPTPYWVSYAELIKLTGAKPVLIETRIEEDFKLSESALRAALTPRTRMLLLCSPSNPTGVVYSPEELGRLADVVLEANLSVVSDEIYDQLVFDGRRAVSFPTVRPGLQDRTVVVAGVSKTYSMTGWRIGWTIAPEPLSKAIANLQSQETSNPSSIGQHAAVEALRGPQDCVAAMCREFQKRRDLVVGELASLPGARLPEIGGAFYAFLDIRAALARSRDRGIATSAAWCEALLEREQVACVAGSAFGAEGHVRMSFAAAEEKLRQGLERIARFWNA
jgi:aspartate aminotransferase